MSKQQVDKITIALSPSTAHTIPVESILTVLKESVALLRDLDNNKTLELSVASASFNSPLTFDFVAETEVSNYDPYAVDAFVSVMKHVAEKTPLPRRASAKIVSRARRIAKVLGDGVGMIEVATPREKVVLTKPQSPPTKAPPTIEQEDYEEPIELEGNLEVASRHGGKQFTIWDRVTGHRTVCIIPTEFWNKALDAMKSDETPRVSVYGVAHYKKDLPATIKVEEFRVLPPLSQAADPVIFQGINITDGIESVEYLRSMMGDA